MRRLTLLLLLFTGLLQAHEYKAVFDCSSDDAQYISSRMNLIEITMMMIEKQGDKADIALTLHGGCVPMIAEDFTEIVDDSDINYLKRAQETLTRIAAKENVEIVACAMSLESNAIEQDEVLPFVRVSKNSFLDTIRYQNNGYAVMTFK